MDFDLRIVDGTIVDGSGREGHRGDVGIHADVVNCMMIGKGNTDTFAPDGDLPGRVLRSLQET